VQNPIFCKKSSSALHRTARADLVEAPNLQFFLQKAKNARFFTSNKIKADASPLSAGAAKRRVENSYREDNTMQISTQSRKRLLFAALFLAILVPLFFTLEIRSQLPLLGFEGGSPLIDWVHQNTTGSGFLRKVTGDATFYSLVLLAKDSRLGALLFFQSIACASIALVLLWLTLYCKRSYLAPFTVAYTILSALIYLATMGDYAINSQAEEYCVLMLWGAYLREGRGLGSVLVYLTVVGCYFVSLARSRRAA